MRLIAFNTASWASSVGHKEGCLEVGRDLHYGIVMNIAKKKVTIEENVAGRKMNYE